MQWLKRQKRWRAYCCPHCFFSVIVAFNHLCVCSFQWHIFSIFSWIHSFFWFHFFLEICCNYFCISEFILLNFHAPIYAYSFFPHFMMIIYLQKKGCKTVPNTKDSKCHKSTQGFSLHVHNRLGFHVETYSYSIAFMYLRPIFFPVTERQSDNKHQCLASKLGVFLTDSARI